MSRTLENAHLFAGRERSPEIEEWLYRVERLVAGDVLSQPKCVLKELPLLLSSVYRAVLARR